MSLESIKHTGSTPEMPISESINRAADRDIANQKGVVAQDTVLEVKDLKMHFPITKGLLKRQVGVVRAVDGVSFTIKRGQTLGIVGESGSGKSTVGNCVIRRMNITSGSIVFNGTDISTMSRKELRPLRSKMTMITQDPFASLDPRMTVRESILEGVQIHKLVATRAEEDALVDRMLMLVGLNPKFSDRYPHEFSGGQRQRISIARGLALSPTFIVCDEIVSALDVSIQAQIVNLMMRLQSELQLTYVFIGHDLSVVRYISDQVAVMYLGQFMEFTSSDELYAHPLHPYTQALISAAPIPNPEVDIKRERILLEGDPPSPINPPSGCRFSTRCKYCEARCREEEPQMKEVAPGHFVACHKVTDGL